MTDPQHVTYFSRLDGDECWALLSETVIGRIAWQGDDGIIVVPVNYQVVDRTIIFHTDTDSSLAKLADGRKVSFQVDEIDPDSAIGWSVLVQGTAGAADPGVTNKSWLDGDLAVGIAVTAASIDGRVVSGTKKG
ncbi:pyridoxamine 5'-phosphate oxidase family protein [Tessaracoccus sp. MC1756]|uniref:pyridoxamine 5'-phosphate oxidase family protein n=1 Tax=Tessaracoccus sp. MC1756 TaxID=2760311 RepID=UPI001600DC01|nr:pyridoxamine 5'-phosphate oxidase family protein [Tessaracoccus sp. MC1756]MBB1510252.1 pyridoxamine 5'-phosphate oxidase family protein [Tessaracoccus sp. MC1756]